jgi:hypothetical protein
MIAGALIGALGGAGLAEGIGYLIESERRVQVSDEALREVARQQLWFTLCVSAHGRARGALSEEMLQELSERCEHTLRRLEVRYQPRLLERLSQLRGSDSERLRSDLEALTELLTRCLEDGLSEFSSEELVNAPRETRESECDPFA